MRLRTDRARELATALFERGSVLAVRMDDEGTALVDADDAALLRRDVVVVAAELGISLREVAPLDDDLESVFRYLVGG